MYKYLLIDSNFLGYRSKYALGSNIKSNDIPVGIVYGFLQDIMMLGKKFSTNKFIFTWDSKKSLRKRIEPSYKAKRHVGISKAEMESLKDTWRQFELLRREILPLMGFRNIFIATGFEGDDLIAEISRRLKRECLIVGSDEDLFQLLDSSDMYIPGKEKIMNEAVLLHERKFTPMQWIKMKAICGCSSDEVKGIKGVGEKTLSSFFAGTLKTTYKTYNSIIKNRTKFLNKNLPLVRLPFKNTPHCELLKDELSYPLFKDLCIEYGFTSFLEGKRNEFWINFLSEDFKFDYYKDAKEVYKQNRNKRKGKRR